MAAGKEIRGKIKSVENTKKITKAMEMVAASKMRKAQDRMRAARPYADKVRNITANLAQVGGDVADLVGVRTGVAHAVLCLAHLGDRDHLHGLGDLLGVLHRFDLAAYFLACCHQLAP